MLSYHLPTLSTMLVSAVLLFSISAFDGLTAMAATSAPTTTASDMGDVGNSPAVIDAAVKKVYLGLSTEYLLDASRTLTLEDILKPSVAQAFRKRPAESFTFGWTGEAVWLKTSLRTQNHADKLSWVFNVGPLSLDSVSLFIPTTNGQWKELRSGTNVPLSKRDELYARTMFPLTLPPNDSAMTVYLRVVSGNSIYLDMVLAERRSIANTLENHNVVIILFLGMMISALFYNTVIFLTMRDKLYGYYVLYAASVVCSYSSIHGLGVQTLLPGAVRYLNIIITISLFLTYVGALLFSKEFLKTKLYAPRFERVITIFAFFIGGCMIPALVKPLWGSILPWVTGLGNVFMCVAAILSARKGYKEARFYIVAWFTFFCGATYFGLVSSGLIVADTMPVLTVLTASTTFELTMFSFILAYRFRRLRDDAETAERERRFAEEQREAEHQQNLLLSEAQARLQESFALAEKANAELLQEKTKTEMLNTQLFTSNAEKSEILGVVAHDLQNPLTSIILSTEILSNLVAEEKYGNISRVLANMVVVGNRMLEIVGNLLKIDALESETLHLELKPLDIRTALLAALEQHSPIANNKSIVLYCDSGAEPVFGIADKQATESVLDNLLSNAVKYSPHGKTIFIRLKSTCEGIRVEIQDEGPGISEEDMKKLFGKFARLSAQPTGGENSTGLGLSIVKKMVDAMNGRVWCESEFGKGATFIVELPTAE
ncbi:MAG: sensor histidine kinase [Candidatus Kapabacteria bacterium]|nr:sensor histidine kinase [Candidatus Kapabacteria bacterium]